MDNNNIRLNPFVYISETDIRFYLLVLIGIVMPTLWIFDWWLMIFKLLGSEINFFLRLSFIALLVFFVPILIYYKYKKSSEKIIKESELVEFDKNKFLVHWEYIENIYDKYLSSEKKPILIYKLNGSEFSFTFGTKNQIFVAIYGRLIKKFRENVDSFKTIFLHEIGHIVNKDVDKANLAESTWQSLKFTVFIPFVPWMILSIYWLLLEVNYFLLASRSGSYIAFTEDTELVLSLWKTVQIFFGNFLYLIIFLGIVYVLRKQIIRLREFYADAKVLEWEKSSEMMIKTLEENRGEHHSKFSLLFKFHPNIDERIQVLKNNLMLFTPSMWVAYYIGFIFGVILTLSSNFYVQFSDSYWKLLGTGIKYQQPSLIIPFTFVLIFIFPFLMIAISSSFHKSILKDIFIHKKGNLSIKTIINIISFSLVFSLGIQTLAIIYLPIDVNIIDVGNIRKWIFTAFYFSLSLIFLLIFGSILIKRSFSKKEAEKNFFTITILSSVLYIVNSLVTYKENLPHFEMPPNMFLVIISFLIFSAIIFVIIKIKDKKLLCPLCHKKLEIVDFQSNCPNCQHNLYSWAIYSF